MSAAAVALLSGRARLDLATARLRERARLCAIALYEATRAGYVSMTLRDLAARLGRGLSSVGAGVRELLAAGLLIRRHTSSSEYKWALGEIDRVARGAPQLRLVEAPERAAWWAAYRAAWQRDRRYWRSPAPSGRPSDAAWLRILGFAESLRRSTGASHETIAAETCARFFRLKGKTEIARHPLVFLAGDLPALADGVRRRLLGPRLIAPVPLTVERPEERRLGASSVLALLGGEKGVCENYKRQ